jgi:toxin ParE1/3/4
LSFQVSSRAIEAIADYIAQDNPMRAVSFIREIREELRLVVQNPLLYQLRPEIGEDARLAVVGRYVILFHIVGEVVRIERVIFGGRDLPILFQ